MNSSELNKEIEDAPYGNIGYLLLTEGKITESQAEKVIELQKKDNIRFGQAAMKLGFISEEDLQKVLSHQFSFPFVSSELSNFDKRLIAASKPFDLSVEKLRSLRSNLLLRWFEQGHKSVTFAGYDQKTITDVISANMAVLFSQLGENTLLVDANLRDPIQHNLLGVPNKLGLTDILADRAKIDVIHRVGSLPKFSILTAGTQVPNSQELLSKDSLSGLVKELENNYDVIIFNTTPLAQAADAQFITSRTKGVVLVVNRHQTPVRSLKEIKDKIEHSGSVVLGCILG